MPKLAIYCGETLDRHIDLADRDLRMGRGDENDVVLTDASKAVSRFHAELRYEGGAYVLIDLNSQNGTWVGGQRKPRVMLQPGVPVTVGIYTLMLLGAEPAESVESTAIKASGTPSPSGDEWAPAKQVMRVAPPPSRRPTLRGKPVTDKSGGPKPGLIAALARMPKPMLFGGFALFIVLIMAVGQLSAPVDGKRGGATTPVEHVKPAGQTNRELRDQRVYAAKALFDKNDYDAAIKELDQALLAMPNDLEAIDLRAKAAEAKTTAAPESAATTTDTAAALTTPPSTTQRALVPTLNSTATTVAPPSERTRRQARETPPALRIACRPGEKSSECAVRDREMADRYERAKGALDTGSLQAAITQLSDIAREEPGYRDVSLLFARAREGLLNTAQAALDAAAKAESEGDLVEALQQYLRAQQMDTSTTAGAEESVKRLHGRMKAEGSDARIRAKQYDAVGRVPEAVALYERAFRYLPDEDPNKKTAKDRLDALRGRQ